jgi:two-component system, NarL family, response regulator NreC
MITVFLVDDHETVREGLRLLINAEPDMEVISEAGDGITAVKRAGEIHPQVIVLDLAMPEMNGLDAARALHAFLPASAIVALTRHSDREFAEQSFVAGARAYGLKQSSSSELLRAIRCAASGEFYVVSALVRGDWDGMAQAKRAAATSRQIAVLRLMAVGCTNKQIAVELQISLKTVEVHKANAKRKLKLSSRADVVRYAAVNGWLKDP